MGIGNSGRGNFVDNVYRIVAKHAFGADIENLDDTLRIGGNTGEIGTVENGILQRSGLEQRLPHFLQCRFDGSMLVQMFTDMQTQTRQEKQ